MNPDNCALAAQGLVSLSYIRQGEQGLARRQRLVKSLLSSRRLPEAGWDEATIEMFIRDCSAMDSNNFLDNVGVGEREGRLACPLVARRHYGLAHGIGRSGDVAAEQPKAAGSSLLAALTAALAGDALRIAGMTGVGPVTVLPLATGMSLTLTLLALRGERRAELAREDAAAAAAAEAAGAAAAAVAEVPAAEAPIAAAESAGTQAATSAANGVAAGSGAQADGGAGLPAADPDVVVWSRVDQKTCLKAVTAAGLTPHVVQLRRQGDQLVTDMEALAAALQHYGRRRVLAVVTTTSCFAPRAPDDVVGVARLCAGAGVPHVVNNAYGVQARDTCRLLTSAWNKGRVDAVVQSTDKNFMVPVGGSLVAAPAGRPGLVAAVNGTYPGRAAVAAHLDLLMTLLHWGAAGWRKVLHQREEVLPYLRQQLTALAARHGERLLDTPGNPISTALTLDTLVAASAAAKQRAAEATAAAAAAAVAAAAPVAVEAGQEGMAGAASGLNGVAGKKAGTSAAAPDVTFFGSMLWQRCVSGTRVVAPGKTQSVGGVAFRNYGSHVEEPFPHTYMTAAAALGTTREDVDELVVRLDKCFTEFKKKCGGV
ncbi:hypothetical protein CHLRE_12g547750v5 [Chlamydomonas reinhardtii]|uniref:O-phosphoseryl-tRNA(Sec) selenium transferase n=1 Tax=Chlamydomonas reinhardtii TaxID=3055 RepID=A0A2K3D6E8_CHLRE|nr:uncharacterized protein CHLRE_12g547750v5 [Chlamydomonas reinhardtii]PNW76101.1 hypothetical protein CHLRE_12g547750v5 [Chlamydomonas reinhardtii]